MTTRAAGTASADTSSSRSALLKTLRGHGRAMTVQELADAVGLHPNSVRFHLTRLIRSGLVHEEQSAPAGPGRPHLVYSIAASGVDDAGGYQLLAEVLSEHLAQTMPDPDQAAVQAGEERAYRMVRERSASRPATAAESRDLITALMQEYGFSPEWEVDGERLWLRSCPLRSLADRQPSVTCSVHLGLLRGMLAAVDAPLEVTSLDPAPALHPCLAHFRRMPHTE